MGRTACNMYTGKVPSLAWWHRSQFMGAVYTTLKPNREIVNARLKPVVRVTSGSSKVNAQCLEVFLVSRDDAVEDLCLRFRV